MPLIDYTAIVWGIVSLLLLGIPLFFSRRFFKESDESRNKRDIIQKIYEAYEDRKILVKLDEFVRFIFEVILSGTYVNIDPGESDLKKIQMIPDVLYSTTPNNSVNSKIDTYKHDLLELYSEWNNIYIELGEIPHICEKLGWGLIFLVIIIAIGIVSVILSNTEIGHLLIYPLGILLVILFLWQSVRICDDWKNYNVLQKKLTDVYHKYPPQ